MERRRARDSTSGNNPVVPPLTLSVPPIVPVSAREVSAVAAPAPTTTTSAAASRRRGGAAARPSALGGSEPTGVCLLPPEGRASVLSLSRDRRTLTATARGGYRQVRANAGASSGVWYFEWTVLAAGDGGAHTRVGVATARAAPHAPVGFDHHSYAYRDIAGSRVHQSLRAPYGRPYAAGDVIGVLLALDPAALTAEELREAEAHDGGISAGPADAARLLAAEAAARGATATPGPFLSREDVEQMVVFSRSPPQLPESERAAANDSGGVCVPVDAAAAPAPGPAQDLKAVVSKRFWRSHLRFFVNGEDQGVAFVHLTREIDPQQQRAVGGGGSGGGGEHNGSSGEGLGVLTGSHHQRAVAEAASRYFPAASCYGGASVRFNPGPNFSFAPQPAARFPAAPNVTFGATASAAAPAAGSAPADSGGDGESSLPSPSPPTPTAPAGGFTAGVGAAGSTGTTMPVFRPFSDLEPTEGVLLPLLPAPAAGADQAGEPTDAASALQGWLHRLVSDPWAALAHSCGGVEALLGTGRGRGASAAAAAAGKTRHLAVAGSIITSSGKAFSPTAPAPSPAPVPPAPARKRAPSKPKPKPKTASASAASSESPAPPAVASTSSAASAAPTTTASGSATAASSKPQSAGKGVAAAVVLAASATAAAAGAAAPVLSSAPSKVAAGSKRAASDKSTALASAATAALSSARAPLVGGSRKHSEQSPIVATEAVPSPAPAPATAAVPAAAASSKRRKH